MRMREITFESLRIIIMLVPVARPTTEKIPESFWYISTFFIQYKHIFRRRLKDWNILMKRDTTTK